MTFMIYGAYGYTGALTAARAVADGDAPILAGRREGPVRELAERLDLPWRAVGLDDPAALLAALEDVELVIHCAGPFSATSKPMVDACLASKTHYLDITGEVQVFEAVRARHDEAVAAGIVLLPGAGFDVVPSDCLAACLAEQMPEAVELELAFAPRGGGLSPGTTKTMVENLPKGGWIRQHGKLTPVPTAHKTREIHFSDRTLTCVAIPWGDLSTAWQSTGIPNITVYMAAPSAQIAVMRATRSFAGLLAKPATQRFLKRQVDRFVHGPGEEERSKARTLLWGAVHDAAGETIEGTLVVPEGYGLTATASLACAERILAGEVSPGATTPSLAFGPRFIETLPGTELRVPR